MRTRTQRGRPLRGAGLLARGPLVLALLAAGCDGQADAPFLGAAGGLCATQGVPCAITERACQQRVFELTRCVADFGQAAQPEVRTIGLSQLERELSDELAAQEPDPRLDRAALALSVLGLLPAPSELDEAVVAVTADNVAAYYDPEDRRVTVLERPGVQPDPDEDLMTLSHEFAHALRDGQSDLRGLQARWARSTDSSLALSSLVEGEALAIGFDVLTRDMNRSVRAVRWEVVADSLLDAVFEAARSGPSALLAAAQGLPYVLGAARIGPLWEAQARPGTDAAFERPDLSVLSWLDPGVPERSLRCFPTAPPEGFVADDVDTLGVVGVFALAVQLGALGPSDAWALSSSYRDDRVVTFRPKDDPDGTRDVAVAYRVRMDSVQSADELSAAIEPLLPAAVLLVRADDELLLYGKSDGGGAQVWPDAAACGRQDELPAPSGAADAMMRNRGRR